MKEIKAFVRSEKADKIVEAMEELGISDITLVDVLGMGEHLVNSGESKYSIKVLQKYSDISKLEMVCRAKDVDRILETLRTVAYTGQKGDGIIYVTPVEKVIKIRTGAIDAEAL